MFFINRLYMNKTLRINQLGLGDIATPILRERMEELSGFPFFYFDPNVGDFKMTTIAKVYPELTENVESAFVLTYYFFKYIQKMGSGDNTASLYKVFFGDWMDELRAKETGITNQVKSYDLCINALVGIESFVKSLGNIIWGGNFPDDDGNKIQYGPVIYKKLLFELITKESGDKFVKLPFVNGKNTILDMDNAINVMLAATLRSYRNHNVHPQYRDGEEKNDKFILYASESRVFTTLSAFMLFAIWYHYDTIYQLVVPSDVKDGKSHVFQIDADPYQLINNNYIPTIKKTQEDAVNRVYQFASQEKSTVDERQHIVSVRINAVHLDDNGHIDNVEEEKKGIEISPTDLIIDSQYSKVLLVGDAGTGKSTMLSQLMKLCIENWQQEGEDSVHKLPIRLDLKMLNNKSNIDIGSVLRNEVTKYYIDNVVSQNAVSSYVDKALKDGQAIVFLDGLDEIAKGTKDLIIENFKETTRKYPCQYIVTSRVTGMGLWLSKFDDFYIYELCPLTDSLISKQVEFTSVVIDGRECSHEKENYLMSAIVENDILHQMATNPMQLMMIVQLLQDDSEFDTTHLKDRIIRNRSELYNEFVQRMVKREREKFESLNSDFIDDLERVLGFVAHIMQETQSYAKMKEHFERGTFLGGRSDRFRDLLVNANSMGLVDFDDETVKFVHNNWQDYFYALKFVKDILYNQDDETKISEVINTIVALTVPLLDDDANEKEQEEELAHCSQLLQNVLELMELKIRGSKKKQDLCDRLSCELAVKFLRIFRNDVTNNKYEIRIQNSTITSDTYHIEANSLPLPNAGLELLAKATAMLDYKSLMYDETDNRRFFRPRPRKLIELLLMNQLILYKRFHLDGSIDVGLLETLFCAVALSGSHRLTDEICSPYWLRMWLMRVDDVNTISSINYAQVAVDGRDEGKCERTLKYISRKLTLVFLYNHTDQGYLLNKLLDLYMSFFQLGLTASMARAESNIIRLLLKMSNRRLISFWKMLKNRDRSYTSTLFANAALLLMKDTNFCLEHYDFSFKCNLHKSVVEALLQRIDKPRVPELLLRVCKDTLVKFPDQRDDILQYMIQDASAFSELKEWLEDETLNILTPEKGIVNMLPLSQVPQWYADKYYDLDIYHYLRDNTQVLTTDIESLRKRICKIRHNSSWRNVVLDIPNKNGDIHRTQVDAVLLGIQNSSHITLVSERIQTSISGCYARYGDKNQVFVVESNSQGDGSYIEITMLGGNHDIPLWGKLHLPISIDNDDIADSVKYVYSIRSEYFHIVRICDIESVRLLQMKENIDRLLANGRVLVNNISMYILSIQNYHYSPYSSIIKLKIANSNEKIGHHKNSDNIPSSEGMISFSRNNSNGKISLKINDIGRSLISRIGEMTYVGGFADGEVFLSMDEPDAGLWVKINHEHHRIRSVKKLSSIWTFHFDSQEMDIPVCGYLKSVHEDGEAIFRFYSQVSGHDMLSLYILVENPTSELFLENVSYLVINDTKIDFSITNYKLEKGEGRMYKHLLLLDDCPAYCKNGVTYFKLPLTYEQPVCNENKLKGEKKNTSHYFTRHVKYSYQRNLGIVRIPEPMTKLSELYFRFNDEGEAVLVSTISFMITQEKMTGYNILELKIGDSIDVPREGFVCFYVDKDCVRPVIMEFSNIISLVQLADHTKYHSSLCDILIDECQYGRFGSVALYSFFCKLGNSIKYVEFYDSLTNGERERHGTITPEIYVVTGLSKSFVHLLSGRKFIEEKKVNKLTWAMETYHQKDENLEVGDLVVREENGSLNKIVLNNQLKEYGFIDGMVVELNDNRDAFIRTGVFKKDFYYSIKTNDDIHAGDVVRFYPSVNASKKNNLRPIATNLMLLRHSIHNGTVKSIEERIDGSCWIIQIQDNVYTSAKIFTEISQNVRLNYLNYFENLNVGDSVVYHLDLPYFKHKQENNAYIVIPKQELL